MLERKQYPGRAELVSQPEPADLAFKAVSITPPLVVGKMVSRGGAEPTLLPCATPDAQRMLPGIPFINAYIGSL